MRRRMRRWKWVGVSVLALAGCDSGLQVLPANLLWMEWPAEAAVGTAFSVRLVGYAPSCYGRQELHVPLRVDQSAVTFQPYFVVDEPGQVCPDFEVSALAGPAPQAIGFFDTRVNVGGLPAGFDRTYEIRGPAPVYARAAPTAARAPQRTFGEITVRVGAVDLSRTGAAGQVFQMGPDGLGCVRMLNLLGNPVVENPPDTLYHYGIFVRGYVYDAPAALCGETRVFHLLTWN